MLTLYVLHTVAKPAANLGEIQCFFSVRFKNQPNVLKCSSQAALPLVTRRGYVVIWWFLPCNVHMHKNRKLIDLALTSALTKGNLHTCLKASTALLPTPQPLNRTRRSPLQTGSVLILRKNSSSSLRAMKLRHTLFNSINAD